MNVVERKRGDRRRLNRLGAKEADAMPCDRVGSVVLVLQGRQALEGADLRPQSRIRAALGVRLS